MNKDYLRVGDLTSAELVGLLDLADELKADRAFRDSTESTRIRHDLHGRTVALVFEKPSTRTRVSFQVAVHELGGHPLPLSSVELQLGRGETIADTGAVLSRYCHAIVVRTFGQDRIEELASAASVPVVNALTDLEHPCQALADLQTVREEFGRLDGVRLVYVGDGNNVANSLLVAGALAGMHVTVAHPDGYAPDADTFEVARERAASTGAIVAATTDVTSAVEGADVIYTDVWTSMGQDAEAAERKRAFEGFRVTPAMLEAAADEAIFLHCLPAHRGEEVAADVIDGPWSRVFDQAENRLHAQKALLVELLTD